MAAMGASSFVKATPPCAGSNTQGNRALRGLLALQAAKLVVAGETELRRSRLAVASAVGRSRTILEREGDAEEGDGEVGACCPLYSSLREVSGPFASRLGERRLTTSRHGVRRVVNRGSTAATNGVAADVVEGESARVGSVSRETKETSVEVTINLDGTGICDCDTGIPFLDHMLDQLASHGLFDVRVKAKGDTHIDDHHTNEDVGLAMGTALLKALGDRKGIRRFGDFSAPLDEALVHVVLDLSGRPYLGYDLEIPTERVGNYDTQLVEHFFQSMANTSGMTLHIRQLAGKNSHHIIEATFKAFARALRQATEYDARRLGTIPSSKGVLSRA